MLGFAISANSQTLYWVDNSVTPAKLRQVSTTYPLPISIANLPVIDTSKIAYLNKSNTFTVPQYFSTIIANILTLNKLDSARSIYLYRANGSLFAYFDATKDSAYVDGNMYIRGLTGQTILTSNSVTSNKFITDSLQSNSPLHLRTDSLFMGKTNDTAKVIYNQITRGNSVRGAIYPNVDYGMNIGLYNKRIDTVNARVGKFTNRVFTSGVQLLGASPLFDIFFSDVNGASYFAFDKNSFVGYGMATATVDLGLYNRVWRNTYTRTLNADSVIASVSTIVNSNSSYFQLLGQDKMNYGFWGSSFGSGMSPVGDSIFTGKYTGNIYTKTEPKSFSVYDRQASNTTEYRRLKIGWTADSTAVISVERAGQYGARPLHINTTGNFIAINPGGSYTGVSSNNGLYISSGNAEAYLRGGAVTYAFNGSQFYTYTAINLGATDYRWIDFFQTGNHYMTGGYTYLVGNATTDGSWRMSATSSGSMLIEALKSGTWTTKQALSF